MIAFDEIRPGVRLRGLDAGGMAEVVQVTRLGADALNLVFRVNGRVAERLVYRGEETAFELIAAGRAFGFDADGGLLRLASEAYRIQPLTRKAPYKAYQTPAAEIPPRSVCGRHLITLNNLGHCPWLPEELECFDHGQPPAK
jgi:hypothetical protein